MIDIKFKDCCMECDNRKSYLNENEITYNNEPYNINTTIGCEHEKVCGEYNKELEEIRNDI